MKPSERIKELSKRTNIIAGQDFISYDYSQGIMDYLDEQWEEKQPCKVCVYKTEERDEHCIRCFKSRITPV